MALAIDKQDREAAKQKRLYLFQIMVDGRYVGKGASSSSGACCEEFAEKLRELIHGYGELTNMGRRKESK